MNVDMPLQQLKEYMGSSPKPADFDAYWQRALDELDQQSLDYELVPSEFTSELAECFDLFFTGVGGARVHCKLAKPKPGHAKGSGIVMFHGYNVDSGDWSEKVTFAGHGITVMALDCRGQGGISEDNLVVKGVTSKGHIIRGVEDPDPDKLYYRYAFLDTVQAARILMAMEEVDPDRVGAYGGSQGGGLAIACAALEPRIKKVVAIYPFLSDYKRAWEMNVLESAFEEIAFYFRNRDPQHKREAEVFNRLGYIDVQNLAPRVKADVLWMTGLVDSIVFPSTQFAAYNKLTTKKELLLFHEHGHENLPGSSDIALQTFLEL